MNIECYYKNIYCCILCSYFCSFLVIFFIFYLVYFYVCFTLFFIYVLGIYIIIGGCFCKGIDIGFYSGVNGSFHILYRRRSWAWSSSRWIRCLRNIDSVIFYFAAKSLKAAVSLKALSAMSFAILDFIIYSFRIILSASIYLNALDRWSISS